MGWTAQKSESTPHLILTLQQLSQVSFSAQDGCTFEKQKLAVIISQAYFVEYVESSECPTQIKTITKQPTHKNAHITVVKLGTAGN